MQAVLQEVPYAGWTEEALQRAALKLDVTHAQMLLEVPGGIEEMVERYHQVISHAMDRYAEAEEETLAGLKIRDKVAILVWQRFQLYGLHREAARRLRGYYMLPNHMLQANRHLWETCSQIWYMAGDDASDFNYYSKRTLLCGVYASSWMVWCGDGSEGHEVTQAFLRRRIEDVMQIHRVKASVTKRWGNMQQWAKSIKEGLKEFDNSV